jgi:hypothetical protein
MTLHTGATRLSACALAIAAFLVNPLTAKADESAQAISLPALDLPAASLPQMTSTPDVLGALPSVEKPLKRLYCVEYARLRSGLAIFGDAKLWWGRAKNLYDEFAQPAVDAVMVFSGSKRIRKGHVAVVTQIVSPREIVVDHANWQNHGEIDRNMPVLDVSAKNDWSAVRVWDVATRQFGSHIYKISGFIAGHGAVAAGS